MILIIAAILPVAFIVYSIYKKDTEKEPLSLLWKCFSRGMLVAIPAIVIEFIIDALLNIAGISGTFRSAADAFAGAALTEEGLKFLVVYFILARTRYFDQFYDGIVYAVFVSMGFALVENIEYVLQNGLSTAIIRGLISVPGHAFFGVFMGYYLSRAFKGDQLKRKINLYLALFFPMILHGTFDFFLMDVSNQSEERPEIVPFYMILFFLLNIWLWRQGFRRIKHHVALDEMAIEKQVNGTV